MKHSFIDSIQIGIEKAKDRERNLKEVDAVLVGFEDNVNNFLNSKGVLIFHDSTRGIKDICLCFEDHKLSVGLMRFSEEIYPISIEYFGEKRTCISEDELIEALRNMASSSRFGDYLKRLMGVINVSPIQCSRNGAIPAQN